LVSGNFLSQKWLNQFLIAGQFIANNSFADFTDILLEDEENEVVVLLTNVLTNNVNRAENSECVKKSYSVIIENARVRCRD